MSPPVAPHGVGKPGVNEDKAKHDGMAPRTNPFKELCWKQFGGGPDEKLLDRMNPEKNVAEGAKDSEAAERKA